MLNQILKHKIILAVVVVIAALTAPVTVFIRDSGKHTRHVTHKTPNKTNPSAALLHPKGFVALIFLGGTNPDVTWQVLNALSARHAVATFGVTYPEDLSSLNSVVRESREGMNVCQPVSLTALKVIDTLDAAGATADDQVVNGLKGVKPGSIVLLHDGSVKGYAATPLSGLATATATSGLVRELRARNLEPGVLDNCTGKVVAGRYTGPN
jgi:hypothetical protein